MVDYSRFELLAKDEERREQQEAAAFKAQRRDSYLKSQKERADRIAAETGRPAPSHSHHTCGCSMTVPSPEETKDDMALHERNLLKVEAIKAAKTDGNRLFKQGDLDLCLQVYERGTLICNGIYGITNSQRDEVDRLELSLDLNIAQVYLKRQRWTDAISQCKMALQLDPSSVKALYRIGLAYEGMGEYGQAADWLSKARGKNASDAERDQVELKIREVNAKARQQDSKAKQALKQIGSRIANASQYRR